MLFINTRPIDRAQPLTECLRQSGFDVVDLPLLALTPRPYNNTLQQLYFTAVIDSNYCCGQSYSC